MHLGGCGGGGCNWVVMGNFAAALAAFQGIFTQCLEDKFGQFISCMIPGLALIFEVVPADDWHDI